MQKSILNDWLLIEIIKQAGIRSADINGMTGTLEFQRNSCTRRNIPMHRINSDWVRENVESGRFNGKNAQFLLHERVDCQI